MANFIHCRHLLNEKPKLWFIWKSSSCLSHGGSGESYSCHRPKLEGASVKRERQECSPFPQWGGQGVQTHSFWTKSQHWLLMWPWAAVASSSESESLGRVAFLAVQSQNPLILRAGFTAPCGSLPVWTRWGSGTCRIHEFKQATCRAHLHPLSRHASWREPGGIRAWPRRQPCRHPVFELRGRVHFFFFCKCRLQPNCRNYTPRWEWYHGIMSSFGEQKSKTDKAALKLQSHWEHGKGNLKRILFLSKSN